MEINQSTMQMMANYLEKTMSSDPAVRRPAECFVASVEGQQNYPLLLLKLVDEVSIPLQTRISAAITFKNLVKKNWKIMEEGEDHLHVADRAKIKEVIVELMLHSPNVLQCQLSEAVSIIGKEDFPSKWPNLLPQMTQKFATGDFHLIDGVLKTAHSLFKRYRYEVRSNALFTEMKLVMDTFARPLTDLFQATMQLLTVHAGNKANLEVIYNSLLFIAKIFLSLNCQDLPEFFEDNMAVWMGNFHTLLKIQAVLDSSGGDDLTEEVGIVEQIKAQVCDIVALYASKYDEEFATYLPEFVTDVWQLLLTTGNQPKYDLLVGTAIQFLASVAERPQYKDLFSSTETLQMLCEKVVIPNMHFRKADQELFEDNPEEYIRRDIEGSNSMTRRKAACELVKALCRSFEQAVVGNFSQYIGHLLAEHSTSPASAWPSKDAALFLVTSLAAKGQTEKLGVTLTTDLVNISDFFTTHVLPELQNPNIDELPVIKADCIKYLMIFRGLFPHDILRSSFSLLIPFINARSHVVHTYAAAAIDKLLLVRHGAEPVITKDHIQDPTLLINNFFAALGIAGSEENEYIMKALMRSISCLRERALPSMNVLVPQLTTKLEIVSKNPSKPYFNHYLFEILCLSVKVACREVPSSVVHFESAFFPVFQSILQNDVTEFLPYVFQVLSVLLEHQSPSSNLPEAYLGLFPLLLSPILWERQANIPALTRLLSTYVEQAVKHLIASDKLSSLLGIFQKLCASRANDHHGFLLLGALVDRLPRENLEPFLRQIFLLLFQRLQSAKTVKFMKGLIVFFSRFMLTYDPDTLISLIDGIQANMFGMVVERVILPNLSKVAEVRDRRTCALGLSRLVSESNALMQQNTYLGFWPQLLEKLVEMFELPLEDSSATEEHFIEVDATPGYQTAYCQLVFASRQTPDITANFAAPKIFLAKQLHQLSSAQPGKLQPMLSAGLTPQVLSYLQKYFTEAGVVLV